MGKNRKRKRFSPRPAGLIPLLLTALLLSVLLPAGAAEGPSSQGDDTASEPAAAAERIMGAGYTAVLYDNTSGLPTSDANDIVQTGTGFILIGGYSGLIRYDGTSFSRYDASIGISSVRCLFVDSRGRIWIGTNESGAAVMENEEVVRFYDRKSGLKSVSIQDIAEDAEGNILIATTMGLACADPAGQLTLIDNPQVSTEYIRCLKAGPGGVIYGITRGGDLFTVVNRRVSAYYPADKLNLDSTINAILPDPDRPGFVYLGTRGSDIYYGDLSEDLADRRILSALPLRKVNWMTLLDGVLWVCTDSGIGCFDAEGNFTELEDLPMSHSVDRMMRDYEGNLWFTSSRQGVMKIVQNRFVNVSRLAGLDPLMVNATCRYRGDLYLGTDTGLIILDKDLRRKETDLSRSMEGVRIRCITADSAGLLWLCTYGPNGLVCYDGANDTRKTYGTDSGLASDRVRTCMELRDGTIAVATTGGLNLLKDGKITATYNNSRGISNLEILCLEEAADGRLFLGSDGDGIYIVDGSAVSRVGLEDGLRSEVILRIRRDPVEELYWIITSNSIAYMRDGTVTTVNNFPYSNNFDLYFDDDGHLWILSSNGVYVVNREAMLANGDIQYTLYDFSCGLPCAATANSFSQLDPDGNLYIAGSTGVCSVNIYDDTTRYGQVRLSVPFLTVDDVNYPVPESGEITIPASAKRIVIHPYAFTYSLSNPHVRYQLEGFDDAPAVLTKRELGDVIYTNLDGGAYRFCLSLIDITTGEAEQTLTVSIIKEKSLHEHPLFWILLAALGLLLVAGTMFFFFRKKTRALERKNEENRRMIQDISGAFAKCIDMKDTYTNGHSTRVAHYTALLASRLGKSPEEVDRIFNIALLHDIGKISIPDSILNKPGRLTDEEYLVMKSHSSRGYSILHDVSIAPELALGAGYHHERFDGTGYPSGLKGDEIPQVAQIIAVADTFDAMYSTRPYRKKMPIGTVADELRRIAGHQLNPDYVQLFLQLIDEGAVDEIDRKYTAEPTVKAPDEAGAGERKTTG